jgi:hypothetical protein
MPRDLDPRRLTLLCLGLLLLAAGCTYRLERRLVRPAEMETLDGDSPFLKAHLRDGRVYVLSEWGVDSVGMEIIGDGSVLDVNRVVVDSGRFRLPVDSVVLFETNVRKPSGASTALAIMTGVTAAVAVYCATNPKACFGSCPTFYAPGPDGEMDLQAEAFSASIAPGLEATDVDMLLHTRPRGREYALRVTNEALETHVIRQADLLAIPRPPLGRVYATADAGFLQATSAVAPIRCLAAEGDCLDAVRDANGHERSSRTDSTDLAARETIELEFQDVPRGELGLVVVSRQTLLTTFLIYQALAYMGGDAGRWLAALETHEAARDRAAGIGRVLGGIEVLVEQAEGEWRLAGASGETGPIAPDTRVVPLGRADGEALRVRLRLTRGLWRLDQVQLVALGERVAPTRIQPIGVEREGSADPASLAALLDPERTLVTLPGDELVIRYRLPENPSSHELFLEATGYYLEWMRQEWLAEEDRGLAARMLLDPAGALRFLAPAFKELEPEMEAHFWSSRYVHR